MNPDGQAIEAQSIREAQQESSIPALGDNRRLYATIAFYYPQYTLKEAAELSYRDVVLLLTTAQEIEANRMYNLTLIAAAPQSDKGKGVKTLLEHFKKAMKK